MPPHPLPHPPSSALYVCPRVRKRVKEGGGEREGGVIGVGRERGRGEKEGRNRGKNRQREKGARGLRALSKRERG